MIESFRLSSLTDLPRAVTLKEQIEFEGDKVHALLREEGSARLSTTVKATVADAETENPQEEAAHGRLSHPRS
jgi:hypothetical protein